MLPLTIWAVILIVGLRLAWLALSRGELALAIIAGLALYFFGQDLVHTAGELIGSIERASRHVSSAFVAPLPTVTYGSAGLMAVILLWRHPKPPGEKPK